MRIIGIAFLIFVSVSTQAQTNPTSNCCETIRSIEVTGSAEMMIDPDEIYITVVFQEWYDGKTKITIDKLEADMFKALNGLGIEAKNISLSDAESNFHSRWLKTDDALLSRNYTIMVSNAQMVVKVYDEIAKMKAYDAFISKVSHSKIEEYRMQTKVSATVAAKNKATQMLKAIGEETGEAILIQEVNSDVSSPYQYSQISHMALSNSLAEMDRNVDYNESQISYQKIKLRYEVYAQFAIK